MFLTEDGDMYDDEYFYEFPDLKSPEDALNMRPEQYPGIPKFVDKYHEILGIRPPDNGQVLDGKLLGKNVSLAVVASVYDCTMAKAREILDLQGF
jgi:hypothetical protein